MRRLATVANRSSAEAIMGSQVGRVLMATLFLQNNVFIVNLALFILA
ncbi:MAG: hypothetical protein F6J86_42495 [Symploca sp. SIO1B1]|nr:hypothetical protein [Symploca sp. SIO1B1]